MAWPKNKTQQKHIFKKHRVVTDIENKLMVTRGKEGRGINWEIGVDIYTVLYIK